MFHVKLVEIDVEWIKGLSWGWVFAPLFAWVLVAYVHRWLAYEKIAAKPSPDTDISDAINYIVNKSGAKLKQAPPPYIDNDPESPRYGQRVFHDGVEHSDALNKLFERVVSAVCWRMCQKDRKSDSFITCPGVPGMEMIV